MPFEISTENEDRAIQNLREDVGGLVRLEGLTLPENYAKFGVHELIEYIECIQKDDTNEGIIFEINGPLMLCLDALKDMANPEEDNGENEKFEDIRGKIQHLMGITSDENIEPYIQKKADAEAGKVLDEFSDEKVVELIRIYRARKYEYSSSEILEQVRAYTRYNLYLENNKTNKKKINYANALQRQGMEYTSIMEELASLEQIDLGILSGEDKELFDIYMSMKWPLSFALKEVEARKELGTLKDGFEKDEAERILNKGFSRVAVLAELKVLKGMSLKRRRHYWLQGGGLTPSNYLKALENKRLIDSL